MKILPLLLLFSISAAPLMGRLMLPVRVPKTLEARTKKLHEDVFKNIREAIEKDKKKSNTKKTAPKK